MFYLKECIDMMYKEGTGEETRNIKIVPEPFPIMASDMKPFYDGNLKWFHDYIQTHNNLLPAETDKALRQLRNIEKWQVVQILIDDSRQCEHDLPNWNKSKIITIV